MSTPKLSKKRKRAAAEGKKAAASKNVLKTPYKRSWPVLPQDNVEEFNNFLKSQLSIFVPKQTKIPWSVLEAIPRESRKEFRQSQRTPIPRDDNLKNSFIFGVNAVTKALEKDYVQSVLISEDANPQMMVNHVLRMCGSKEIPVLVVPGLRNTLKQLTGIASVCFAFKNVTNNVKLKEITEFVKKTKKIDTKTDLINTSVVDGVNTTSNLNNNEDIVNMDISEICETDSSNVNCSADEDKRNKIVYLYRTDLSKREFIPPKSKESANMAPSLKNTGDFISLTVPSYFKESYKPSQVMRIKAQKDKANKRRSSRRKKNKNKPK